MRCLKLSWLINGCRGLQQIFSRCNNLRWEFGLLISGRVMGDICCPVQQAASEVRFDWLEWGNVTKGEHFKHWDKLLIQGVFGNEFYGFLHYPWGDCRVFDSRL